MQSPTVEQVHAALARVIDPEIRRPITEIGMVGAVEVTGATVAVHILLTTTGCPMRERITTDVTTAVRGVPGVADVAVTLGVMSDEQRAGLKTLLRGGVPERAVPFSQPGSRTRVYAVASGKGGVGKSSVTANLAAAMAADGLAVGLLDADIYGFSIPRMLGVTGRPTKVGDMIMPPVSLGVKVVSMGMFVQGNTPVAFRGPKLHRALEQFLTDFEWGELDVLLLDLPPGTGDIAISTAHLLPTAELVVVTTPQLAAAEVAERAGSLAKQTSQRVAGVIENMSYLPCPHCTEEGRDHRLEVFGAGGGQTVADALTGVLGARVPLLGQVPLDGRLREGGDSGVPLSVGDPTAPASVALREIAQRLGRAPRSIVGRPLSLTPVSA
ncbi:ATP-binding protein involved in chromosome partitioning [Motilibacter peucedani]|uniref:Iron-sulfur cluster carrier protein n=1 Tax=Motilibacter peucedani TaxID=598650 RepID=A0A420XM55_9ACTN|nr:P-loop NTPase [Motilibacter peucedani]RKS72468.1 ATP-binding protein involved in chromosome partitioning [Motilibacter peucedani]